VELDIHKKIGKFGKHTGTPLAKSPAFPGS
jgi:hypothetical protein